jgi:predicted dienelactone hydrolase
MKLRLLIALSLIAVLFGVALSPAAAQRPDAPAYAKRGPFVVGTRELQIPAGGPNEPALTLTVWYPALNPDNKPVSAEYRLGPIVGTGRALRDAPPDSSKAKYPLIIFAHGLGAARIQLVTYTEQLASHGFFVMAVDHPGSTFSDVLTGNANGILDSFGRRPLEVLRQIAFAEQLTAAGGPFAGLIDTDTVGVTGHSFGGYTTFAAGGGRLDLSDLQARCKQQPDPMQCAFVNRLDRLAEVRGLSAVPEGLWPATTDPRIKAIAPLAPSSGSFFSKEGMAAITIPMLIMVGSRDLATPTEENATPMYQGASSATKALVTFENAGHYIFVEKCVPALIALGRFGDCSDLVWDMDRAHDLINHFGTAFFLATLKGDEAAARALRPAAVNFAGVRYDLTGSW